MVIDLDAERRRRALEREFNPGPVRDFLEVATAYAVVAAAFGVVIWVLLQPRWM